METKKIPMKKKSQSKLTDFGYTVKVQHRGVLVDVAPSKSKVNANYPCSHCKKGFLTKAALTMHVKWCLDKKKCVTPTSSRINPAKKTNYAEESLQSEVKLCLSNIIDKVINLEKNVSSKSKTRRSYSNVIKMQALNDLDNGMLAIDVASKHGVNRSMITRWNSSRDVIANAVAEEHKKRLFKKNRRRDKHHTLLSRLYIKFQQARQKGMRCSHTWLYTRAKQIHNEDFPDAAPLPRSIVVKFIEKYKVKCLRVQRRKQKDNMDYMPAIKTWHSNLREGLIKTGQNKIYYDQKWGRFSPKNRFNVDQVPLPFAVDVSRTYEVPLSKDERRNHRVWVNQPGSGLNKRQCTLQLAFGPVTPVKPALIFRGTGKRISESEMAAHDKDIDIYFQENAWADTAFSVNWVNKTLKPTVENLDEYVLFCDNLVAQTKEEFKNAVRNTNGVVWYGVPNATNVWQPVDCGYGQLYKSQVAIAQEEWLEDDENIERWLGNSENKLTASERRILISNWVGVAHRKIIKCDYDHVRWRAFEKTGCLLTADGSEDGKVQPEGLNNYEVPAPLNIRSSEEPMEMVMEGAPDNAPEEPFDLTHTPDGNIIENIDAGNIQDEQSIMDLLLIDTEMDIDLQ